VASSGVVPSSVQVFEDGRPVSDLAEQALSQSGRTFDIVLAIDTSDSVKGAPLQAAIAAAKGFVEQLPTGIAVGVLTFSDQPRVVQRITTDHSAALRAISSITGTQYGTTLYGAVTIASGMFSGSAQHNVVLLTDGSDVGSHVNIGRAIAAAKTAHVGLFTVGLGSHADVSVLQRLSNETAGGYLAAVETNLSTIYQGLARVLSNQFVLTYHSSSPAGAEVTVDVGSGSARDRSFVLLPRVTGPAVTGSGGFHLSLHGNLTLAIVLTLLFLGLFGGGVIVWGGMERSRRQRSLARRMAATEFGAQAVVDEERAKGPASWIPQSLADAAERLGKAGGFNASLERRLERSGVPMTPGEFLAVTGLAIFVGLLIGLILRSPLYAVVIAAVGGVVPYMLLRRAETKRIERLHQQLPEVLMILASALRAGHSLLQALDTVAKEIGEPSSVEYARIVAEIRLGRPPHEALSALAERVGTEEFKWAMLGMNVQREVGGNLAEILDTLAETVRERDAIRRQVKVLSAEARLSMKIMVALPPLLVLYMIVVNPDYMKLLWTTRAGFIMIGVGGTLLTVGVWLMRKLVKVDV
jgi:tight adherence protein B